MTLDATARAPWAVSVSSSASLARAHLVIEGECVLKAGTDDEVTLKTGDLAYLPRGDAHLIGSSLDAEATALSLLVKTPIPGELVPIRLGRDGPATRWIAISASCERHLADPLIAALPTVMKVGLNNAQALYWLTDALGLTLSASAAPPVGATAERARLAELVVIEAISRYVYGLPAGGKGWLAGLNDRYVGRALALVHGRPSEPWTVDRLAGACRSPPSPSLPRRGRSNRSRTKRDTNRRAHSRSPSSVSSASRPRSGERSGDEQV